MKGAQNDQADMLSRLHANALHVEPNIIINFKDMAVAQENDTELVLLNLSPSSLLLRDMPLPMSTQELSAMSRQISLSLTCFRCAVFDSLRSLLHPGIQTTHHLVTARFM